jgi:hypothetical protein
MSDVDESSGHDDSLGCSASGVPDVCAKRHIPKGKHRGRDGSVAETSQKFSLDVLHTLSGGCVNYSF